MRVPRAPDTVRPATPADAGELARIYNDGIAERVATFETRTKSAAELAELIEDGALVLVAECDGEVVAFVKVGPYDDASHYYAGIGEATLYVDRAARRSGAGRALMEAVAEAAERRGYYKLVGKIFTSNAPSIALVKACGWREVGVHRRHGRLDGEWKDVLVVERLMGEASD
jgi:L-amino acid N-acyltransferase YncA